MKTYETKKGVDEYIKMCKGYDYSFLKNIIEDYINPGVSMLEIGMGPGNDFSWLNELYEITGSDYSDEFLKRAILRFPENEFVKLDAISILTNRLYDSIFSNKVYQHFTIEELNISLKRQSQILNSKGIIAHSFWIGGFIYKHDDMTFYYHDIKNLKKMICEEFEILYSIIYKEFEDDDSILIIAKKKI